VGCQTVDLDLIAPDIRLRKRAEVIESCSGAIVIPYRAKTCGKIAPMCCGPIDERSVADGCGSKPMMVVLFL
jgi:hypothetical protein